MVLIVRSKLHITIIQFEHQCVRAQRSHTAVNPSCHHLGRAADFRASASVCGDYWAPSDIAATRGCASSAFGAVERARLCRRAMCNMYVSVSKSPFVHAHRSRPQLIAQSRDAYTNRVVQSFVQNKLRTFPSALCSGTVCVFVCAHAMYGTAWYLA